MIIYKYIILLVLIIKASVPITTNIIENNSCIGMNKNMILCVEGMNKYALYDITTSGMKKFSTDIPILTSSTQNHNFSSSCIVLKHVIFGKNSIICFDIDYNSTRWIADVDCDIEDIYNIYVDEIYAYVIHKKSVSMYELENGKLYRTIINNSINDLFYVLAVNKDMLFITDNIDLLAYDLSTMSLKWSIEFNINNNCCPAYVNNKTYFVDDHMYTILYNNVYSLMKIDINTGHIVSILERVVQFDINNSTIYYTKYNPSRVGAVDLELKQSKWENAIDNICYHMIYDDYYLMTCVIVNNDLLVDVYDNNGLKVVTWSLSDATSIYAYKNSVVANKLRFGMPNVIIYSIINL